MFWNVSQFKRVFRPAIVAALTTAMLAGCEKSAEQTGKPSQAGEAQRDPLPADFFVDREPAGAKDVDEIRKSAKPGESVVMRGRIGGGKEPFVSQRAAFTVVDHSLKSCENMGADHCPTPWDYCCERWPEHSVAVQVVGANGKPLTHDLNGEKGVKPLADVIVIGKVSEKSDASTVVVNATAIYVRPKT
jgi:hypothetical protein